jgi:hypothetical protein
MEEKPKQEPTPVDPARAGEFVVHGDPGGHAAEAAKDAHDQMQKHLKATKEK